MSTVFSNILASEQFREEFFVADVQSRLANMLEAKGLTRAELARKLGVSRARVTQIFSDEATNFTLRLLVRSFLALEEELVIVTKTELEDLRARASDNRPSRRNLSVGSDSEDAAALIADILRTANFGNDGATQDRATRRAGSALDWAKCGSNVVDIEERRRA